MSELITIFAYQTGLARIDSTLGTKEFTCKDEAGGKTIKITREMLDHRKEAEGEMEDFKDMFGELFNGVIDPDAVPNVDLKPYKIFLSFGSTSLQGWMRDEDGKYEVIIPKKDGANNYETLGVKSSISTKGVKDLNELLITLGITDKKKVLCFNGIGYKVNNGDGNEPINIEKAVSDEASGYVIDALKNLPFNANIDIFPRKGKIGGKQIAGQWARGFAKKNKSMVLDIGGGAAYLYDKNGTKLGENSLIESNDFYKKDYSEKKDDELLQALCVKIRTKTGGKRGKKSRRAKSKKNKRTKKHRRHRK